MVLFTLGFLLYGICIQLLTYYLLQSHKLQGIIAVELLVSFLFFVMANQVSPGTIQRTLEGEILLLLTKFDPKTLCPTCEVVQLPSSKHCFVCN